MTLTHTRRTRRTVHINVVHEVGDVCVSAHDLAAGHDSPASVVGAPVVQIAGRAAARGAGFPAVAVTADVTGHPSPGRAVADRVRVG